MALRIIWAGAFEPDRGIPRAEQLAQIDHRNDDVESADLFVLQTDDGVPCWEALTETALAVRSLRPVAVLDGRTGLTAPWHLALVRLATHYVMHVREQDAIGLADVLAEHGCGVALRSSFASSILDLTSKSASPIERRLALHLACASDLEFDVEAQKEITIDGRKFRADFVVSVEGTAVRIVVEADGHDFHERTKEQATRDKRRDRAMLADGFLVMRFTGSEIWRDPSACAEEVMATMRLRAG